MMMFKVFFILLPHFLNPLLLQLLLLLYSYLCFPLLLKLYDLLELIILFHIFKIVVCYANSSSSSHFCNLVTCSSIALLSHLGIYYDEPKNYSQNSQPYWFKVIEKELHVLDKNKTLK